MKLRKAVLGERLRAEQPPKDASTQTTATSAASPSKAAAAAPATPRQRSALLDDAPSMVCASAAFAGCTAPCFQNTVAFEQGGPSPAAMQVAAWGPVGCRIAMACLPNKATCLGGLSASSHCGGSHLI